MSKHHRVSHRAAAACLLALSVAGGCVWSPTDGGSVTSRYAPVDADGYASVRSTRVQVQAWNYERDAWEPLRVVTAADSGTDGEVTIYAWAASQLMLGKRYWMESEERCDAAGAGRLRVREWNGTEWAVLKSFDQVGKECVGRELAAGRDIVAAGVACYTGDTVRMAAPGECATAVASDTTPPTVVLRITDDEQAWEVTSASPANVRGTYPMASTLHVRADAFDPQGPGRISGIVRATVNCRGGDGWDHQYRRTFLLDRFQDTGPGVQVERSVGWSRDISRDDLQAMCGPRETLSFTWITASATGHTVSGVPATTKLLSFESAF